MMNEATGQRLGDVQYSVAWNNHPCMHVNMYTARYSTTSKHSELTPMLHLNALVALSCWR
jgi:hypothetical protein